MKKWMNLLKENANEAVGEFAEPIYNLIDIEGEEAVLDELIRYMDGDTIKDFVADYKRHHDMDVNFDEGKYKNDAQRKAVHAAKAEKTNEDTKEINHNNVVQLAGDSIWQGKDRDEEVTDTVNVGKISINKDEDGYISVSVDHDGPWTIYTDTGFEDAISEIIGMDVSWSEQGMQEQGTAHLEADYGEENESIDNKEQTMEELDRILKIAGLQRAPVGEENINELNVPNDKEKIIARIQKLDQMADEARANDDPNKAYAIERGSEMAALYTKLEKLGGDPFNIPDANWVTPEGGPLSYKKVGEYTYIVKDENGKEHKAEMGAMGDEQDNYSGDEIEQTMDQEGLQMLIRQAKMGAPTEDIAESACGCCNESPCSCADDCDCKTNESIEEAKKELDEEPNEGNEFSGALAQAKKDGKKEFEVDGKKYKVESEETDEEVVSEAPTMDTTQLINLLKNSGISEETINKKLDEWANTPAGVGEEAPTDHGDAYEVAQMVNLSLKRYLDAQDMKVNVSESHTSEEMKAKYANYKK